MITIFCRMNLNQTNTSVRAGRLITGWTIRWLGVIPGRGWEFSSLTPCPDWLWGPHSLLTKGYQGLFSWGVKCPGHEAGHSPPSSAEVKGCMELYLHSSSMSSWYDASLSIGATFPFTFYQHFSSSKSQTKRHLWRQTTDIKVWIVYICTQVS
jgi:hypothetical protein